jgi:hypothetical protein
MAPGVLRLDTEGLTQQLRFAGRFQVRQLLSLALRSYVDQVTAFQNLPAGTTFTWSFSPYIRKVHETPTYVVLVPDPSDARIAGWVEIAYTHPGGCLNTVRRNVWIGAPTSATGDIQGPPSLCPNGTGTYYAPNFPAIQNVTSYQWTLTSNQLTKLSQGSNYVVLKANSGTSGWASFYVQGLNGCRRIISNRYRCLYR